MKRLMVSIENPEGRRALKGAVGVIVGYDFIPGDASEENPLCDIRLPSGSVVSYRLKSLRLVGTA